MIKGTNAINKLTEVNDKPKKNALQYIKAGTTLKVCIPNSQEVAQVFTHGAYGFFNSFLCTGDDLIDKAVKMLYEDASKEVNPKKAEELKEKAYTLKAKERYLFGFFKLEDGEPLLVDLSKKQGQSVLQIITQYKDVLTQFSFQLSKLEGGTISLSPILTPLTPEEKAIFDKVKGTELPIDLYENAVIKRDIEGQIEDLTKFGIDVSRLISSKSPATNSDNIDNLPF